MKNASVIRLVLLVAMVFVGANVAMADAYKTFSVPGAQFTSANCIYDNVIGGDYSGLDGHKHGYTTVDEVHFVAVDVPNMTDTVVNGMSAVGMVGTCTDVAGKNHGWKSTDGGKTFGPLIDVPNRIGTEVTGISDAGIIVGYAMFSNGTTTRAFRYDGVSFTSTIVSGYSTYASGIYGTTEYGWYSNGVEGHGFMDDFAGTAGVVTFDAPGDYTVITGVFGPKIIGYFSDQLGGQTFLYDGVKFAAVEVPGMDQTIPAGIFDDTVVGLCLSFRTEYGFIYTVPEPATLGLLCIGSLAMLRRRRQQF